MDSCVEVVFPHWIKNVFLNKKQALKNDRNNPGPKLPRIPQHPANVVVVDGDEDHLQQRCGSSNQVEDHHADGEALRRFAPEVEQSLRSVLDQAKEGLDVACDSMR